MACCGLTSIHVRLALTAMLLLAAGCDDLFVLNANHRDLNGPLFGDGGDGDGMVANADGDAGGVDLGGDLGTLPAACARLSCAPTVDEGNLDLDTGTLGGCHAYRNVILTGNITVSKSLALCAEKISVTGFLTAIGEGDAGGVGAGKFCGSGGSHGGLGADPGGCGLGAVYGDAAYPRTAGSGGGGSGSGSGGGIIELAADQIDLATLALISVDGKGGGGASAGGGSGGSVLLSGTKVTGNGQVSARGGLGFGIAGGGGGGGRIAIYGIASSTSVSAKAGGGKSVSGMDGSDGTVTLVP